MLVVRQAFRSILQKQNPTNISYYFFEGSSIYNARCVRQKITVAGLQNCRSIWHSQQLKVNKGFLGHRTICSEATDVDEQERKDVYERADGPREVYRFYGIILARLLIRLKFYQTAFMAATVSHICLLKAGGEEPSTFMVSVAALMVTSIWMFIAVGNFCQKFVCILNYDEASKTVHITHLTFWGKQRNVSIPLTKIIPISDFDASQDASILRIDTYDNSESFLLYLGNNVKVKDDIMNLLG